MADWPKIVSRRRTRVSPWMEIIEREVEFAPGAKPELYHAVGQQDYIAIVALTPDGPFRSCGNTGRRSSASPGNCLPAWSKKARSRRRRCSRELLEETGLPAQSACTRSAPMRRARRGCRTGCIRSLSRPARRPRQSRGRHRSQAGDARRNSARLIRSGEFVLQLHIGALLLAGCAGISTSAPSDRRQAVAFDPIKAPGRKCDNTRLDKHPGTLLKKG